MAALAEAGWRSDGYAAAILGLNWFVAQASEAEDFELLVGYLRFPDIAPAVVAARALIHRYGMRGLAATLDYADSDEIAHNTSYHLICELHDLHLVENFPVRALLLELRDGGDHPQLHPFIDHLLSEKNLSADSQGALIHLRRDSAPQP